MTIYQRMTRLAMTGLLSLTPVVAMAQQANGNGGYNHSTGTTTTIGSDRQTGAATPSDAQAMQSIRESIQRQRQMNQRP